jgi:hypothetical protein
MCELITHNIVYFFVPILLSVLILISYHLIKKNVIPLRLKEMYLILASLGYSVFVMYISPFENLRYLFGVCAILIVIPLSFVRLIPLKILRHLVALALCGLYLGANFSPAYIKKAHLGRFAYPAAEEKTDRLIFRDDPAAPVYLFSSQRWRRGQLIAYFDADQEYKLITEKDPLPDFYETGSKEIYVIIEQENRKKALMEHLIRSNWRIQNNVPYRYYHILHLHRNITN